MAGWLAARETRARTGWVKRFDPRLWTVDFPRPMMAAVTAPGPNRLRVDLDFLTRADLAGLIWDSVDRWSHPLLAYATARDYRGVRLSFDWISGPGLVPLDALFGPVLTVEGRDEAGAEQSWYVRLWTCAMGTPTQARIVLDFDDLRPGFAPGGPAIFTGDIDRMFISLVPLGYDGSGAALPEAISTFVELVDIRADGPGSTIAIGDAFLPEHGLGIASGYDDSYNQVPERLVGQWLAMGYRGPVIHYVGMSHFPRLAAVAGGRFEVAGGLSAAARAWHAALLAALKAAGFAAILSLSYELFDAMAPAAWAQRDWTGARALTGWVPPSTLLSPCSAPAMAWLQGVAAELAGLAADAGGPVRFQVGEPWWWVGPDGAPCFYDAATVSRWTDETGSAPPVMADVRGQRSAAEIAYLDWLGARLADSTAALVAAASAGAGAPVVSHLLFYAPQVLDALAPDLRRANMPVGWANPAFDVLQLEDYSFVSAADEAGRARGVAAVTESLGYPVGKQHYLAGFVLSAEEARTQWPRIEAAAQDARARGVPAVFLWAWPQVARDGFVALESGAEADEMGGFHDVVFPLDLGFEAAGGPEFATEVIELASGHEQRNSQWAQGRLRYEAGIGVRSDADLQRLIAFFRARRGQAFSFRFRDPMDWTSAPPGETPAAGDQILGTGDGLTLSFPLVKRYGEGPDAEVRRITRPVPGSVQVAVGGVVQAAGWRIEAGGILRFDQPPPEGAAVTAGFVFDVPVRFASDRLEVSIRGFRAGEPVSAPLIEVREDAA
ncbi:MAG: TIGR02217 family protein [Sphingomonadaceae bacterium]